jgi:Class II flagellar assembly regulator
MRIYGPNGVSTAPTTAPKRTSSGNFSLDIGQESRPVSGTAAPRSIGGLETLMALQAFEEPTERRRRAIKRGRAALDALDALKLGLLSGSLDASALARLKSAAAELGERSGEPGLDSVLAEIELRVEVELAKIGMPASRGT